MSRPRGCSTSGSRGRAITRQAAHPWRRRRGMLPPCVSPQIQCCRSPRHSRKVWWTRIRSLPLRAQPPRVTATAASKSLRHLPHGVAYQQRARHRRKRTRAASKLLLHWEWTRDSSTPRSIARLAACASASTGASPSSSATYLQVAGAAIAAHRVGKLLLRQRVRRLPMVSPTAARLWPSTISMQWAFPRP